MYTSHSGRCLTPLRIQFKWLDVSEMASHLLHISVITTIEYHIMLGYSFKPNANVTRVFMNPWQPFIRMPLLTNIVQHIMMSCKFFHIKSSSKKMGKWIISKSTTTLMRNWLRFIMATLNVSLKHTNRGNILMSSLITSSRLKLETLKDFG